MCPYMCLYMCPYMCPYMCHVHVRCRKAGAAACVHTQEGVLMCPFMCPYYVIICVIECVLTCVLICVLTGVSVLICVLYVSFLRPYMCPYICLDMWPDTHQHAGACWKLHSHTSVCECASVCDREPLPISPTKPLGCRV